MDFRRYRAPSQTTMVSIQITALDTHNSGIWISSAIFASWAYRSIWITRGPKELDLMLSRRQTARRRGFALRTCNLSIGKHQRRIRYCIPLQSGCEEGWDVGFLWEEPTSSRNPSTMHRLFPAEAVVALSPRMRLIWGRNEVSRISISRTA